MLQKPLEESNVMSKRSYSYQDLLKMKSQTIYSSMGLTLTSEKPSAPRATIDRADRNTSSKKFLGRQFEKELIGKQGLGPAAYLPSSLILPDGKAVSARDPLIQNKYNSSQSFSIGKYPRQFNAPQIYQYMKHQSDVSQADVANLKRRLSSPNILIGTARRFSQQRSDKITPGPTYDPVNRPQFKSAPRYSIASAKVLKGQDACLIPTSTTNLVGPGTYFQKVKKSNSTSSLSRIPHDSNIKRQPQIAFGKGSRTLTQLKNSVDETYDIKHKTIASHYDFEYDGGKGFHSGKAYMKKNLINSAKNPIEKNKMASYTIGRTSRDKDKRGEFKSSMTGAPQSVRIQIPKF